MAVGTGCRKPTSNSSPIFGRSCVIVIKMKSFMMAALLALPLGAQEPSLTVGPVYGATVNMDDV